MKVPDADDPAPEPRRAPKIHHRPGSLPGRFKPESVTLLHGGSEAQGIGQELRGAAIAILPDGDAMHAADGMLGRHGAVAPGLDIVRPGSGHDLQQQAVGIAEGEHMLVEPASRALELDAVAQQPLDP